MFWGWHGDVPRDVALVTQQRVVGRVTSPAGNKGEQWKTPGRRENGEGERVERQGKAAC